MRLARILIACVALALAAVPAARAAGLDASPAGGALFPSRSVAVTPPTGKGISAAQVHVTENGQPVPSLTVTSSTAAAESHFGVVLVIDTSQATSGEMSQIIAAAKAFASHRNPHHPVGVVAFSGRAVTQVPLTKDIGQIDAALDQLHSHGSNRHTYDAVSGAISLLRQGGAVDGSIVLVSAGADTGSRLSADESVAQARASGVRVFSVGVAGPGYDGSSLQTLANGTDGEYSIAERPADLQPTLDDLGKRVAGEYLVTYRSLAAPGKHVDVAVTVDGLGGTSFSYVAPHLVPGAVLHPSTSFWQSSAAIILVALLCAVLLGMTVSLLLRPDPNSLQARMSHFVAAPGSLERPSSSLGSRALEGAEMSLERSAWWARFKEELEIARIQVPAIVLVAWTGLATFTLFIVFLAATQSLPLSLLALFLPIGVRMWVQQRLSAQRKLFSEQLAETLAVVASAMRAGQSLVAALSLAVEDAPEPTHHEFERVVVDERLGVPLEEALRNVARRMESRELEQVIVVASLQRETGGNTAEVLDHVAGSIRERLELLGMVKSLTAQGRLSRWILTLLPVGLFLFMLAVNSKYMHPLVGTSAGHLLLAVAIAFIITGSLVIKRIVEIKV